MKLSLALFYAITILITVKADKIFYFDEDKTISASGILKDAGKNVQFSLKFPKNYWAAIGFASSMFNSPMFVLYNNTVDNNSLVVDDYYSEKESRPKKNDINYFYEYKDMQTYWDVNVTRSVSLQRVDRVEDLPLNKALICIYAFSPGNFGYHKKQNRGQLKIFLDTATSQVQFYSMGQELPSDVYYRVHGIIMYSTWSILTFLALISGRYMKHFHNFRMIIHASVGTLIMSNTVIIVYFALTSYKKDTSLELGHSGIGIAVMILSILQFFGGITVRQANIQLIWKSKLALISKYGHKIFGCLLVFISNFQVVSGLVNYESPVKSLIYGHFAIYVVALAIIEVLFRFRMKNKEKGVIIKPEIPTISQFQFNNMIKAGKKLVLFNNFVVNVENFMDEHPGTRFVISHNIGKEIGKYFYGAYSLEQDVAPYAHSSYAASLIKRLTVGKLEISKKYENEDENMKIMSKNSALKSKLYIVESDYLLEAPDLVFTVRSKTEINESVSRIEFHGSDTTIKKFYSGLKLLGKGYSITSLNNYISRYYTICNCMGSAFREEYLSAFRAALNSQSYKRKIIEEIDL